MKHARGLYDPCEVRVPGSRLKSGVKEGPISSYAAGHCEGDTARHEAIRGAGKLVAEWLARTGRKPLNVQAVF